MKLLCFLGFHKEISLEKIIFKDKNQKTVNVTVKCSNCGKIIEEYGYTRFGMFVFDENGIKLENLNNN